jgi:hypothetical protein
MCSGKVLRAYQKFQSKDFGKMNTKWNAIGYYCNKCNRFYSNGFVNWLIIKSNRLSYKTITVFSFDYQEYQEKFITLQKLARKLVDKLRDIRHKHTIEWMEWYAKSFNVKTLNNFK